MADKLKELSGNNTEVNRLNFISVHENYVPVPLEDGLLFDSSFGYDDTGITFGDPQAYASQLKTGAERKQNALPPTKQQKHTIEGRRKPPLSLSILLG